MEDTTTVLGKAIKISPGRNESVWVLLSTDTGEQVVRFDKSQLARNVKDSVQPGMRVLITGDLHQETGPAGDERDVLVGAYAGIDLTLTNVMVIDGEPRPFYLTDNLTITDTPALTQQHLRFV